MRLKKRIANNDVIQKVVKKENVSTIVFEYEPEDRSVGIYEGLIVDVTFSYDDVFGNLYLRLESDEVKSNLEHIKNVIAEIVCDNDKNKDVEKYILYPNENYELVKRSAEEIAKYMELDDITSYAENGKFHIVFIATC